MANTVLYLKAKQNAEVMQERVCVKDIASVYCADKAVCAKARALKIYQFGEKDQCQGVSVESLGENDILIELVNVDEHKGFLQWLKLTFVAAVSFFGTGFTIMAFHNDISVNKIFSHVYELVMGYPSDGYSILEVSYSIGLAAGIILFFNHIGGRRITKDPTPIEVEMRVYETDVNKALIETADREGKSIDA